MRAERSRLAGCFVPVASLRARSEVRDRRVRTLNCSENVFLGTLLRGNMPRGPTCPFRIFRVTGRLWHVAFSGVPGAGVEVLSVEVEDGEGKERAAGG